MSLSGLEPTFDRTYEGLKHRLPRCRQCGRGPFDRTYEGLKPPYPVLGQGLPHLAFDRTYEGLKLVRVEPIKPVEVMLLTVPMRV